MAKLPGINHLEAVKAFEKGGLRIIRQGRHIVMSDGLHFITIPRHIPSTHSPWLESFATPA